MHADKYAPYQYTVHIPLHRHSLWTQEYIIEVLEVLYHCMNI